VLFSRRHFLFYHRKGAKFPIYVRYTGKEKGASPIFLIPAVQQMEIILCMDQLDKKVTLNINPEGNYEINPEGNYKINPEGNYKINPYRKL
jgi:hypothetical protein